jgi:hypothetical protein
MELADGEGTQSEILRFSQNDSACIFPPFAIFSQLQSLSARQGGGAAGQTMTS